MVHATVIARAMDGLILAETHGDGKRVPNHARCQVRQMLKKLRSTSQSYSVDGLGDCTVHFTVLEGVCYLAIFDPGYPCNLAFSYLEDIRNIFREELKCQFGTGSVDYRSQIDCIEKPYFFAKLDRHIVKTESDYKDPSPSFSIARSRSGTLQASSVMRYSIDDFLCEGHGQPDHARSKTPSVASKRFTGLARMCSLITLGVFVATMFITLVTHSDLLHQHVAILMVVLAITCVVVLGRSRVHAKAGSHSAHFPVPAAALFSSDELHTDSIL